MTAAELLVVSREHGDTPYAAFVVMVEAHEITWSPR